MWRVVGSSQVRIPADRPEGSILVTAPDEGDSIKRLAVRSAPCILHILSSDVSVCCEHVVKFINGQDPVAAFWSSSNCVVVATHDGTVWSLTVLPKSIDLFEDGGVFTESFSSSINCAPTIHELPLKSQRINGLDVVIIANRAGICAMCPTKVLRAGVQGRQRRPGVALASLLLPLQERALYSGPDLCTSDSTACETNAGCPTARITCITSLMQRMEGVLVDGLVVSKKSSLSREGPFVFKPAELASTLSPGTALANPNADILLIGDLDGVVSCRTLGQVHSGHCTTIEGCGHELLRLSHEPVLALLRCGQLADNDTPMENCSAILAVGALGKVVLVTGDHFEKKDAALSQGRFTPPQKKALPTWNVPGPVLSADILPPPPSIDKRQNNDNVFLGTLVHCTNEGLVYVTPLHMLRGRPFLSGSNKNIEVGSLKCNSGVASGSSALLPISGDTIRVALMPSSSQANAQCRASSSIKRDGGADSKGKFSDCEQFDNDYDHSLFLLDRDGSVRLLRLDDPSWRLAEERQSTASCGSNVAASDAASVEHLAGAKSSSHRVREALSRLASVSVDDHALSSLHARLDRSLAQIDCALRLLTAEKQRRKLVAEQRKKQLGIISCAGTKEKNAAFATDNSAIGGKSSIDCACSLRPTRAVVPTVRSSASHPALPTTHDISKGRVGIEVTLASRPGCIMPFELVCNTALSETAPAQFEMRADVHMNDRPHLNDCWLLVLQVQYSGAACSTLSHSKQNCTETKITKEKSSKGSVAAAGTATSLFSKLASSEKQESNNYEDGGGELNFSWSIPLSSTSEYQTESGVQWHRSETLNSSQERYWRTWIPLTLPSHRPLHVTASLVLDCAQHSVPLISNHSCTTHLGINSQCDESNKSSPMQASKQHQQGMCLPKSYMRWTQMTPNIYSYCEQPVNSSTTKTQIGQDKNSTSWCKSSPLRNRLIPGMDPLVYGVCIPLASATFDALDFTTPSNRIEGENSDKELSSNAPDLSRRLRQNIALQLPAPPARTIVAELFSRFQTQRENLHLTGIAALQSSLGDGVDYEREAQNNDKPKNDGDRGSIESMIGSGKGEGHVLFPLSLLRLEIDWTAQKQRSTSETLRPNPDELKIRGAVAAVALSTVLLQGAEEDTREMEEQRLGGGVTATWGTQESVKYLENTGSWRVLPGSVSGEAVAITTLVSGWQVQFTAHLIVAEDSLASASDNGDEPGLDKEEDAFESVLVSVMIRLFPSAQKNAVRAASGFLNEDGVDVALLRAAFLRRLIKASEKAACLDAAAADKEESVPLTTNAVSFEDTYVKESVASDYLSNSHLIARVPALARKAPQLSSYLERTHAQLHALEELRSAANSELAVDGTPDLGALLPLQTKTKSLLREVRVAHSAVRASQLSVTRHYSGPQ